MSMIILGIESSCDDTAAAIIKDNIVLSNVVNNQNVHNEYGGVVPRLATRYHQRSIIPTVHKAIKTANVSKNQIDVIACTRVPGLKGSLLAGAGYGEALAMSLNKPLISVNHIQAHILSHLIIGNRTKLPLMCLTISGGHTLLVLVNDYFNMNVVGRSIDDAIGEALVN